MTLDQIIHTQKRIGTEPDGITLSSGDKVIVDPEDFRILSEYSWHKDTSGYAYRHSWNDGKDKPVRMHRQILSAQQGEDVDHINGNRMDNRRSNLRICSRRQNLWNSGPKKANTSGFKGVDFVKAKGLFRARIRTELGRINLGYFKTAEMAAESYRNASSENHGEFSKVS